MLKDLYKKLKLYGLCRFVWYCCSEIIDIVYWRTIKGSYSQLQEDLQIDKVLIYKKSGFYVDIGASDPIRFNNTRRFYLKGWQGINIEPNANVFERIKEDRKRDINLNIGVGTETGEMNFFVFFPDTLCTFSRSEADNYIRQGFKVVKENKIKVRRLEDVFDEYVKEKKIDFLSIDTEGRDLDVLKSNNWERYRPSLICVELHTHDNSGNTEAANIENYLNSMRYNKQTDTGLNGIFVDSK